MAQYKRVYVEVEVQFISDGSMRPRALIWHDGRKYEIERILDVRPACAQKAAEQLGHRQQHAADALGRHGEETAEVHQQTQRRAHAGRSWLRSVKCSGPASKQP